MPDKTTDVTQTTESTTVSPSPTPRKPRKPRQSTKKVETIVSDTTVINIPTTPPSSPTEPTLVTLSSLLEQAKKVDEYSIHVVNKERNEIIKYNEVFNEVKIEQLVTELYDHIKVDEEKGLGFFNNTQMFVTYINFLIIKYFTNLNEVLSGSLEENIITIEELRKLKYFKLLFQDVFDNDEVLRVYETVNQFAENADKLMRLEQSQLDELINTTQTPFLKEKLEAKKKIYPIQSSLLSESN